MSTVIYYFTGTGNSLWAARTLASELGGAELRRMPAPGAKVSVPESQVIGLVFPVHIWGLPRRVLEFVRQLNSARTEYLFAVAVNAGQVSRTLVQLDALLRSQGQQLHAGFSIVMPSNYTPWGGPGPQEKLDARFHAAADKLKNIAACVRLRETHPVEKGPLVHRIFFTLLYKISFNQIPSMDKKFTADEKCTGCGTCAKVCPSDNVTFADKRPLWNHRCEQCFACLQWCPAKAIQCGPKTPGFERYHHPEIKLADMTVVA